MATEAERRALRKMPEYQSALDIGDARRALRDLLDREDEVRLTAYLYSAGIGRAKLAELFDVEVRTIQKRLAAWRRLAG